MKQVSHMSQCKDSAFSQVAGHGYTVELLGPFKNFWYLKNEFNLTCKTGTSVDDIYLDVHL